MGVIACTGRLTMSEPETSSYSVLAWVTEGTWPAVIDATRLLAPANAQIALMYVVSTDLLQAAHGPQLGLLGRGHHGHSSRIDEIIATSADELLAAAARRLDLPCDQIRCSGRPEREVIAAAVDADLLVLARDWDQRSLGPRSLGRETRFVVDHAPCQVLLVWPGEAPSTVIPPPPPPHKHGRGPHHP